MARARGVTTDELLTVNGVVLNTLAKNIESLTGRLRTPAKRTSNIVVPGRHGAVRVTGKLFDQNVIVLPMWVVGCQDDGTIPKTTNERRLFFQNVDVLTSLFQGSDDQLDIRHTWPDGSVRQAFGEVLDVLDFTTTGASPIGKVSVSITMADPFWRDLNEITAVMPGAAGSTVFNDFIGTTAPIDDSILSLTGPWTSPEVHFIDGSMVAYDAVIPAGTTYQINSDSWTITSTGGSTPTSVVGYGGSTYTFPHTFRYEDELPEAGLYGGKTINLTSTNFRDQRFYYDDGSVLTDTGWIAAGPPLDKLRHSGPSSRWVSIPPPPAGVGVQMTMYGSGRTSATKVGLTGHRKFLVG